MIGEMDQVVSSMLGQPSLKEMSGAELKHLALQYPYASFLHLLRSRKLKDAKDPEYPASVAITALYFNNPHWLHHQLQTSTLHNRVQEWEKAMGETDRQAYGEVREDPAPVAPLLPEPAPEPEQEPEQEPLLTQPPAEPEVVGEEILSEEEVEIPVPTSKLSDILKAPVSENADLVVPIEPLYTVDYFASMGIRPPQEGDALGNKLKSFTEWLKAMRRIHPEKVETTLDTGSENRVRREADLSNDNAGVATETMAEVLIRQGLREKAIEVYRKLSLLEPAKSAYFAAKIDELKAS